MQHIKHALEKTGDRLISKAIYQLSAPLSKKQLQSSKFKNYINQLPVYFQLYKVKNGIAEGKIVYSKDSNYQSSSKIFKIPVQQLTIPSLFPAFYKKPQTWLSKIRAIADENRLLKDIYNQDKQKNKVKANKDLNDLDILDSLIICGSTIREIYASTNIKEIDIKEKRIFKDKKGNTVTINKIADKEVIYTYTSSSGLIKKSYSSPINDVVTFLRTGNFKLYESTSNIIKIIKTLLKGVLPALTLGVLLNWLLGKLLTRGIVDEI